MRSPLSAVSDSFGHENELDISKSSEEKTSATGSKVAPSRMGSLFSPMEKNNNNKKEVHPCYIGDGNFKHGASKKRKKRRKKTACVDHLGVRRAVVWGLTRLEGLVT